MPPRDAQRLLGRWLRRFLGTHTAYAAASRLSPAISRSRHFRLRRAAHSVDADARTCQHARHDYLMLRIRHVLLAFRFT